MLIIFSQLLGLKNYQDIYKNYHIEEYKIDGNSNFEQVPDCIRSWRAHDDNVESCQFVSSSNGVYDGDLIITASSDWCCRLWTMEGAYIGKKKYTIFNF